MMDATQPPEPRVERAILTVTKREKQALRFIAIHRNTTESELLRERLIGDIAAEFDRLMALLAQAG